VIAGLQERIQGDRLLSEPQRTCGLLRQRVGGQVQQRVHGGDLHLAAGRLGPLGVLVLRERQLLRERQDLLLQPEAIVGGGRVQRPDPGPHLGEVELGPAGVEEIAAAAGDDEPGGRAAVRLQPAPDHRDVVLQRRHVVTRQIGAPDRVGQGVLGLDPVVAGGEDGEDLAGTTRQLVGAQADAVLVGHGELTEDFDAHTGRLLAIGITQKDRLRRPCLYDRADANFSRFAASVLPTTITVRPVSPSTSACSPGRAS
jgi:hypothetical protein